MSRRLEVVCFCEDIAHERFIRGLIQRAAEDHGVSAHIRVLNATHGSRVWLEFRQYLQELAKGQQSLPDVLVVVIDGNCKGASQVRQDIEREVQKQSVGVPHLVCAVPDPHVERWYLDDQQALKSVLPGARSQKLSYKCERDRYKRALRQAIRDAGVEPLLGGAEYGEDIARKLEPSRLDSSFQAFWNDLSAALMNLAGLGGNKSAGIAPDS
jgi:hypothetical protein